MRDGTFEKCGAVTGSCRCADHMSIQAARCVTAWVVLDVWEIRPYPLPCIVVSKASWIRI